MPYKPVSPHTKLRNEVMLDPDSRAIYEATKLQIEISLALKKARKNKHMTQDEVAELMQTHKPVISRLESGNSDVKHFPSLLTIAKFALAVGCQLRLDLVPIRQSIKIKRAKSK
jgi:DNA-binding XRE family transcriptional regulator